MKWQTFYLLSHRTTASEQQPSCRIWHLRFDSDRNCLKVLLQMRPLSDPSFHELQNRIYRFAESVEMVSKSRLSPVTKYPTLRQCRSSRAHQSKATTDPTTKETPAA